MIKKRERERRKGREKRKKESEFPPRQLNVLFSFLFPLIGKPLLEHWVVIGGFVKRRVESETRGMWTLFMPPFAASEASGSVKPDIAEPILHESQSSFHWDDNGTSWLMVEKKERRK